VEVLPILPDGKESLGPTARSKKLRVIEGIGETYAPKLQAVGIKTVADLLEQGKTRRAGRNSPKPQASPKKSS
jgi:hypothetical protein